MEGAVSPFPKMWGVGMGVEYGYGIRPEICRGSRSG